jgi:hypothetical protein
MALAIHIFLDLIMILFLDNQIRKTAKAGNYFLYYPRAKARGNY